MIPIMTIKLQTTNAAPMIIAMANPENMAFNRCDVTYLPSFNLNTVLLFVSCGEYRRREAYRMIYRVSVYPYDLPVVVLKQKEMIIETH